MPKLENNKCVIKKKYFNAIKVSFFFFFFFFSRGYFCREKLTRFSLSSLTHNSFCSLLLLPVYIYMTFNLSLMTEAGDFFRERGKEEEREGETHTICCHIKTPEKNKTHTHR